MEGHPLPVAKKDVEHVDKRCRNLAETVQRHRADRTNKRRLRKPNWTKDVKLVLCATISHQLVSKHVFKENLDSLVRDHKNLLESLERGGCLSF